MLRRTIFSVLVIVSFCAFFVAREAKAQTVYGITAVEYDQNQQRVYAYSATETDYYASYYYDAYVEGYIFNENGNTLDSGSQLAYIIAEVYTSASTSPGHTYYIISDHYVGAYYYEDYGSYFNYFDPYGFSFAEGGRYGSTYGFLPGPSTYQRYRLYYLGTTGIELILYGEPHIDQMVPTSAPLDSSIEVNFSGSNFGPNPSINVGGSGVSVSSITYVTDTRITAIFDIAANASTGNHSVSVSARGYTSNSVNLQVGNQTPQITGINPSGGTAGDVVGVTISGRGFGSAPSVSVSGGINVQITSSADQQITANFSIPSTTLAGDYTVRVTSNGFGGSGFISTGGSSPTSNGVPFTVQAQPPPHISAYAPNAAQLGVSVEINIQGEHFGTNPTLNIGGRGVTVLSYANVADRDHQIVAILDIAADAETGNHPISVSTRGQTSNSVNFQVGDRSPQITQITPSSGTRGTTFQVVVTGSGFGSSPTLAVSGTGVNVTLGTTSDTQINATFSISSLAELLQRTVTVTSRGITGNGFIQPPGGGPSQATVPFDIKTVKVKIDSIDKRFAPSVENLDVHYSITPVGVQVPAAKLEVFKKGDTTTPIFIDTSIDTGPSNHYPWNGMANQGTDQGKFIGPENSPYTVRITIATNSSFGTTNRPVEKEFLVELDTVETTPAANADYSIVKTWAPNNPRTEIETVVVARVRIKNKANVGVLTAIPFQVHWSFEDPDDTADSAVIDADGKGDDNTVIAQGGKRGAGSIMWKAETGFTSNVDAGGQTAVADTATALPDQGMAKIKFASSVIGGDNYVLKAQVKNSSGQLVKEIKFKKWSVRKNLDFTGAYQMTNGADVKDYVAENIVRGAYSGEGYTDYHFNSANINPTPTSPARLSELQDPLPLTLPNGLPNPNTEMPTNQELADFNGPAGAAKTAAEQAITAKAQRWFDRNRAHMSTELTNFIRSLNATGSSIVGARDYHVKFDGVEGDGRPAGSAPFYPNGIIVRRKDAAGNFTGPNIDPNSEWTDLVANLPAGTIKHQTVQAFETNFGNLKFAFVFLNQTATDARRRIVGRHEIGHASDHVLFGPATETDPKETDHWIRGLMHRTADQVPVTRPDGDDTFADDSILRLRGRKR